MKQLLKNKKGSIFGDIGSWIQGIIQIVPAPLLFLIFLLLLATATFVLSIIFNAFGIYCNSANQVVKLNGNIFSGVSLIDQIPDPALIQDSTISADSDPSQGECARQISTGSYIYENGTRINFTSPKYFYFSAAYCNTCTKITLYDGLTNQGTQCLGNVYRINDSDLTFWQKTYCWASCRPPEHYYYSFHNNKYVCADHQCGEKTLGQAWDAKLSQADATLLYGDTTQINPAHDHAVGIICEDLKPRLGLYGLDLFNYTIIFILAIIMALFWIWKELT